MAPPRRQLDLRAAAAAIAATDPASLTMAGVARSLGLAKPTLYRLAGSRDELVAACVEAEAERLHERLHRAFADDVPAAAALRAVTEFADDSPGGFELLFGRRHPEARPALRRLEDRLADLIRRATPDDPPARPDLSAAALLGASAGVAARLAGGA